MANYAFTTGRDLPSASNGERFEYCNFMQAEPNTAIFEGVSGLVFENCNLINCTLPPDAQIIDCLHIQKELCANLYTDWAAKGLIPAEPENCPHVIDSYQVFIDGQLVDTVYHYEDTIL